MECESRIVGLASRRLTSTSTPAPVTANGNIVAMLAGRPAGKGWDEQVERAAEGVEAVRDQLSAAALEKENRRADCPAMAIGISYGGGQTVRTPISS